MRHLKLLSNHTVLIISKQCPQTNETQSDMKFITIDLGFNLSFVYAHDGESQTAPSPSAPSFGCDVWGRELGGDEGVQVSVCLHVSSSVEVHGVLQ